MSKQPKENFKMKELVFATSQLKLLRKAKEAAFSGQYLPNAEIKEAVEAYHYFNTKLTSCYGDTGTAQLLKLLPPVEPRSALLSYYRKEKDLRNIKIVSAELTSKGSESAGKEL